MFSEDSAAFKDFSENLVKMEEISGYKSEPVSSPTKRPVLTYTISTVRFPWSEYLSLHNKDKTRTLKILRNKEPPLKTVGNGEKHSDGTIIKENPDLNQNVTIGWIPQDPKYFTRYDK